jgi:tetratricopeptide (TPR) repeat protein
VTNLGKLFWPMDLAVSYAHTGRDLGLGLATVAGLGLVALTALVFMQSRRRPWLAEGWFWYLGMLVPMLGLVQFGGQDMADRFVYLPMVGIFIVAAWGFPTFFKPRRFSAALAVVVLASFAAAARCQVGYWHDTFSLFKHAYQTNPDNPLAMKYYGLGLASRGSPEEGYALVKRAHALNPNLRTEALIRMATRFEQQGRISEATSLYLEALGVNPSLTIAREGLERLRRQSTDHTKSK